jgi:hypothetical protein
MQGRGGPDTVPSPPPSTVGTSRAARSPLAADLTRFTVAATDLDYSGHVVKRAAERVVVRLLIGTGRSLTALTAGDLEGRRRVERVPQPRLAERASAARSASTASPSRSGTAVVIANGAPASSIT